MIKSFFNDSKNHKKYCLDSRTPSIELDETIPYQKKIKDALSKLDNEITISYLNTNTDTFPCDHNLNFSYICDCSNNCDCLEFIKKNNGNIKNVEKNNRDKFINLLNSPQNLTPRSPR